MLKIKNSRKSSLRPKILAIFAVVILFAGLYILLLVFSPALPQIFIKPIDVAKLEAPQKKSNRIIIPKIGVDIQYASDGESSLDRGAWWRYPERGDPKDGGNFIIAAHRFSIQPTPMGTIEKSPFFNIDKLTMGDKIIVDYDGKRYGYEINEIITVEPNQIEIEAPSDTAKLTLYSCELGGAEAGRIVIIGQPLGEVSLSTDSTSRTQ